MSEIDFFGHFGYFFLLMGLLYVSEKEPVGWLFRFFGEAIWIGLGFALGLTSVWMWGFVFLAVDFYSYNKWKRDEKEKRLASVVEDLVNGYWGTLAHTKFGYLYDPNSIEYHGAMTRLFRNEAK